MALTYQKALIWVLVAYLCLLVAPVLLVAAVPILLGLPFAAPAAILAGGGWLSRRAWALLVRQLIPLQEVGYCSAPSQFVGWILVTPAASAGEPVVFKCMNASLWVSTLSRLE